MLFIHINTTDRPNGTWRFREVGRIDDILQPEYIIEPET